MSDLNPITEVLSREPASISEILQGAVLNTEEPLVAQIYRILWDEIVRVRILPGQLISEKEIADALQASKTPVREALIRLEDTGLVHVVPKSGTYVTPIRLSAYIEACFTRLQLEIGAVRRAAGHSKTHRDHDVLDEILHKQEIAWQEDRQADFFALDEQLHRLFFRMAGVPGVWNVLQKTQADVYRIRQLKRVNKIRRGPEVLAEHILIVDAIKRGDKDAAEVALVTHIGSLEGEIEQLATYPELLEFIESGAKSRSARGMSHG